jgi:hypothetical protein
MKIILTALIAFSFAATLAGDAGAAGRRHKERVYASQYRGAYAETYADAYGGRQYVSGYHEQRLEVLPLGSQQWWDVYERQRGGRR